MKRTRNEFIEKAILVHGNEYDYSLVNYIKNNDNIIIICKKHGQFSQLRSHHLKGSNEITDDSFIGYLFKDKLFDDCFFFFEEKPEYDILKIMLQEKEDELLKDIN